MSGMVAWIAAEAESCKIEGNPFAESDWGEEEGQNPHPFDSSSFDEESLRAGSVSPKTGETRVGHPWEFREQEVRDEERARRIYRGRTVAMLRRYMRYSLETGRLPSLLGREFFRTRITKYTVVTFEDRVIFVHDMERCLERLDEESQQILGRIVLQEYEHEEAAKLLGCTRMTVHRKFLEALDSLSDILVAVGLLDALPGRWERYCQDDQDHNFWLSVCRERK